MDHFTAIPAAVLREALNNSKSFSSKRAKASPKRAYTHIAPIKVLVISHGKMYTEYTLTCDLTHQYIQLTEDNKQSVKKWINKWCTIVHAML